MWTQIYIHMFTPSLRQIPLKSMSKKLFKKCFVFFYLIYFRQAVCFESIRVIEFLTTPVYRFNRKLMCINLPMFKFQIKWS